MSHGRWWGSLLPLNHLRTAASPCPRWFPLKFGNFCQDMEWQRMVVWASILQSTADIRHLYRFAKEIHQKKAKSMVFQYSKYLVDFNKISPIPSWKKPWDTNLISRTSIYALRLSEALPTPPKAMPMRPMLPHIPLTHLLEFIAPPSTPLLSALTPSPHGVSSSA